MLKKFFIIIADLVFPGSCVSCGKSVSHFQGGLCDGCFGDIEYADEKCVRCSGITEEGECVLCGNREFYPEKNIAVASFAGVMKKIIENYKFNGRKILRYRIADAVFQAVDFNGFDADIITSVPVSKKKKWQRGYNHAELISRTISTRLNIPYRELLREKRKKGGQKFLGYRERFLNIIGRFEVRNPGKITGKSVFLVDDIFTTGATVNECARKLLQAGAGKVFSLTIARSPGKKA